MSESPVRSLEHDLNECAQKLLGVYASGGRYKADDIDTAIHLLREAAESMVRLHTLEWTNELLRDKRRAQFIAASLTGCVGRVNSGTEADIVFAAITIADHTIEKMLEKERIS